MSVLEGQVGESFVGLDDAETRLPAKLVSAGARLRDLGMLVLIGAIQVAWVGALGYFAYIFVTS